VLAKPPLLDHARAAVERTARSLSDLQASLDAPSAARLGRRHRLLLKSALLDLGHRHARLSRLYAAMRDAPEEQVPACWQRFFACYDEYLETARDARTRLVREEVPATRRTPYRNGRGGRAGGGT
jgi:hypothetical protein